MCRANLGMATSGKRHATLSVATVTLVHCMLVCCLHIGCVRANSDAGLSQTEAIRQALCSDKNSSGFFDTWTGDCVSELFMKYGKDGRLEYDGFTQLLENVGLGAVRDSMKQPPADHDHDHEHDHDHAHAHESNSSVHAMSKRMADRTMRRDARDNSLYGANSRQERHAENSTLDHDEHTNETSETYHDPIHVDHHHTELEHTSKCLSADEILDTFSVIPSEGIIPLQFLQLCPILLQQLDSQACIIYDVHHPDDGHNHTHEPPAPPAEPAANLHSGQLWGYSIGAVTMISVASVTCIMMVPCIQRFPIAYGRLLSFLVAMAVGTLSGDSVLHLLPHAFGIHNHGEEAALDSHHAHPTHAPATDKNVVIWRGCVVLVGIFSFFIFEQVMRMCQKRPKKRLISLVEEPPSQRERSCHSNHSNSEDSKQSLSDVESQNKMGSQEIGERLCNHNDTAHELIPMMHQDGTDDAKVGNERFSGVFTFKNKSSVIPHTELKDKNKIDDEKEEKKSHSSLDLSVHKDQETSYGGVSTSICKDPNLFSVSTPSKSAGSESNSVAHAPSDHEHDYRQHSNDHHHHHHHHHHHGHSHHGHSHAHGGKMGISAIAWMVVMGDGVHNFTDGLIVGAAFADSLAGGLSTAIAVMCHEIPHELGDFAVMLRGGMSIKQALAFQAVSSILAYIGMIIGLSIGHLSDVSLWIFALAGGAFLYIALTDLFPEMVESMNNTTDNKYCHLLLQFLGALFGIGTMLVIALYEERLIEALAP